MSLDLKKLNLGQKIRKLREGLGQTINDFSTKIGLTSALLQQIEKGEISPPIATLLNIAHQAGEELGYFFDVSGEDKTFTVIRKGAAKQVKRVLPKGKNPLSYSYKNLAPEKISKKMEPFMVEFSVRKETVPQVAHDGEEFVFVLSGRLEFKYRNKKMILNQGDSLYFESRYPHAFKALGKSKARAVVVLYPH